MALTPTPNEKRIGPIGYSPISETKDGSATPFFARQWQNLVSLVQSVVAVQQEIVALQIEAADLVADVATINATEIGGTAGQIEPAPAPLSGGNITLSLADTAVTPDTYGDATNVPQLTVDSKGRITGVVSVPISGGGGGSIDVEDDGVSIVTGATVLNFSGGGVTVTDNGSGEALITITGSGGGGGVPTVVQSKAVGVASLATGITMDAPPADGNILVAVAFNCVNTSSTVVAPGWTSLNTSATTPDPITCFRVCGPGESAIQTPSSSTHGGAIAIIEIAGATQQGNPNSFGIGTATGVNVPFVDDSEFLAVASGLGIGLAGGLTTNTISWTGVFSEEVQGNFAAGSTGGVNPGSVSIATFTKNVGATPSGGITVPSSAAIFVCWALFQ